MDKRIVQQVILETLDAVNDQVKMISDYNGKIPWIEIDITKDYLRTLYENVLVLERYNGIEEKNSVIDLKNEIEKEVQKKVAFEPVKEEDNIVREKVIPSFDEKPIEKFPEPVIEAVKPDENDDVAPTPELEEKIIIAEPIEEILNIGKEPEPQVVTEQIGEKVKVTETKKHPKKSETIEKKKPSIQNNENGETLADKLKIETKSLGETIQSGEKTLGDNMGKKPIRKLKSAIGINDKFFFVNELFHGVLKDYNETISALDEVKGHDEANTILNIQQEKQNWDVSGEAYVKLKDFVDRKFIIH